MASGLMSQFERVSKAMMIELGDSPKRIFNLNQKRDFGSVFVHPGAVAFAAS